MARKRSTLYKPKALIDGAAIDQEPGSTWVAIPDSYAGRQFAVSYGGAVMTIKDWKAGAQAFKRFRDKYWYAGSDRRQHYTLGYFRFSPDDGATPPAPLTQEKLI